MTLAFYQRPSPSVAGWSPPLPKCFSGVLVAVPAAEVTAYGFSGSKDAPLEVRAMWRSALRRSMATATSSRCFEGTHAFRNQGPATALRRACLSEG
jgi:hypothetical protein